MNKKQANELSVQELLLKIKNFWHFLLAQFWKILLAGFLGAILFFCYAFIQPITYTAGLTFVLDESKSSNNNGLASLAGQFGMDLGNSGGGGLLAGDNIYLYFKSESLIKDVLLSVYDSTHNKSLADAYVEMYDFNEQWAKNEKIKKVILFSPSLSISQTTRLEDSLLRSLSYMLIKQCFFDKADKKGSFLKLEVTLKDEKLAKIFCERLLQRAVQKYIDIKVGRQRYSFNKLQERADSISKLLKQQTFSQAELQTENSTMDINPLYKTNTLAKTELTTRDKAMLTSIYAEVIKNLEMSRFTLSQETPVIQIVDWPVYPLKKNYASKRLFAISGFILASFLTILFLSIKKKFSDYLSQATVED